VLLVEDEPDTREMLKAVLEIEGASVNAVGSASEAWDALEAAGCDIIVSDIGMPEEDGYTFVARVRERDARLGTRTPAVALTAYTREEDRARSLAAGFDAHVPKPVEPPELLSAVARFAARDS
jgi:CheY-like chemotaxis protein